MIGPQAVLSDPAHLRRTLRKMTRRSTDLANPHLPPPPLCDNQLKRAQWPSQASSRTLAAPSDCPCHCLSVLQTDRMTVGPVSSDQKATRTSTHVGRSARACAVQGEHSSARRGGEEGQSVPRPDLPDRRLARSCKERACVAASHYHLLSSTGHTDSLLSLRAHIIACLSDRHMGVEDAGDVHTQ